MSMKLLFLIVCLVHSHGSSCTTAEGKRYEYQSMVDPLTRRSPLDKNFMRFGRSSAPTDDDTDGTLDESTRKPEEEMNRLNRAKDNFIRFGRSDEGDKEMERTERARPDNFIRFGRGRDVQNFIRFGRGRDNFMRFGRGRNENFMRFGRGRQENFMRFGRGRQDNFMRFGKKHENEQSEEDLGAQKEIRSGGGKSGSNFMRFGRDEMDDSLDEVNSLDRSGRGKASNFLRFGRGKQESGFIRFGRNGEDQDLARSGRGGIPKQLLRFSRPFQDKHNDGFIRFGRPEHDGQRAKRSTKLEDDMPLYRLLKDYSNDEYDPESSVHILPYDLDEEYESTAAHQEVWNRKKRSIDDSLPQPDVSKTSQVLDSPPLQLHLKQSPIHYYPSPLSAGLPNFIVGPEFSLLPALDISSTKLKRGKAGDRNFIRLG